MWTLPRLPWLQWPVGPFDEAQTSWGQSPLLHEVGCSSDGIDSQRARLAVSQGPVKAECPWGLDSWSHWLKTSSEQKKCLGRGSRDVAVGPRRVSCLTASLSPFPLLGNGANSCLAELLGEFSGIMRAPQPGLAAVGRGPWIGEAWAAPLEAGSGGRNLVKESRTAPQQPTSAAGGSEATIHG